MNQQLIDKFLHKAGARFGAEGTDYSSFTSSKFAELIVRECASICEINGQSYKYSFTPAKARLAESTSNHCAMMINKHFGVKK
jgi:hypothetical protein